jgi:hypothetical protein
MLPSRAADSGRILLATSCRSASIRQSAAWPWRPPLGYGRRTAFHAPVRVSRPALTKRDEAGVTVAGLCGGSRSSTTCLAVAPELPELKKYPLDAGHLAPTRGTDGRR